jgi:hypothetical protein
MLLIVDPMGDLCGLIWCAVAGLFRSRAALQAEILILRHQLNGPPASTIYGATGSMALCLSGFRLALKVLGALRIPQPETVIRWHRAGLRELV